MDAAVGAPSYAERARRYYVALTKELCPKATPDFANEHLTPFLASEIVRLRAFLDRYSFPVESWREVWNCVSGDGWKALWQRAALGRDDILGDLLGRWAKWLDHRTVSRNGGWVEWSPDRVPEDAQCESEDAKEIASALDRYVLLIYAADHMDARIPAIERERDVIGAHIEEFYRETSIAAQEVWHELVAERVAVIVNGLRPVIFQHPCFRKYLSWVIRRLPDEVRRRPVLGRSPDVHEETPPVPGWRSDGGFLVSPDGWRYWKTEAAGLILVADTAAGAAEPAKSTPNASTRVQAVRETGKPWKRGKSPILRLPILPPASRAAAAVRKEPPEPPIEFQAPDGAWLLVLTRPPEYDPEARCIVRLVRQTGGHPEPWPDTRVRFRDGKPFEVRGGKAEVPLAQVHDRDAGDLWVEVWRDGRWELGERK